MQKKQIKNKTKNFIHSKCTQNIKITEPPQKTKQKKNTKNDRKSREAKVT